MTRRNGSRWTVALAASMIVVSAYSVGNESGFELSGLSANHYAGTSSQSSLGNRVRFVGLHTGNRPLTNRRGDQVSIGFFSPNPIEQATPSPTPTASPTFSPAETETKTPTASATECMISASPEDFDLSPNGRVDAGDLLLWLSEAREGRGVDFNCNTQADPYDLILLSRYWFTETD